ncbi:MAG: hypothetical protein J5520_00725 [Bacteroidales bacterium]|nr:hypothetical protein [Bacteroidales bacterium]
MQIKLRTVFYIAAVALLAVSCRERQVSGRYVIPYVGKVMSDTSSAEYRTLSTYDIRRSVNGTIAVLGEPEETLTLSEYLLGCDLVNNINGAASADGLPDFSGEVISPLLDIANAPYIGYVKAGKEDYLSEINVRNFIAAVDSSCYLSAYDEDKIVRKARAKVVILSSSYAAAYGYYEIDSLSRSLADGIPVFSTVHSMLSQALDGRQEGANLGIWASKDILGSGVYSTVIPDVAASKGVKSVSYEVLCPESSGSVMERFLEFLDRYKAVGGDTKLSAVVVDDPSVNVDSLRAAVASIVNMDHDKYLLYKMSLEDGFKVVDAYSSVAASCQAYLRESNRFTHRIAYPDIYAYVTSPCRGFGNAAYNGDGSFSDSFKFGREENSDEVTYSFVELKDKYLPSDVRDFMIVNTPKIFSLYVR